MNLSPVPALPSCCGGRLEIGCAWDTLRACAALAFRFGLGRILTLRRARRRGAGCASGLGRWAKQGFKRSLRRLRIEAVRGQDRRRVAVRVFCHPDKHKSAIDFLAPGPDRVLEGAREKIVELVAEGRSRGSGGHQGGVVVNRGGHRALDNRNIRIHGLQQLGGVRIVQQCQEQMLQRDIAMGALLSRVPGAAQCMIQISGTRQFRIPRGMVVHYLTGLRRAVPRER